MIEINLLPGARKKKAARRESIDVAALLAGFSGRFGDKVLIGTVVAVVASAAAGGWMYTTDHAAATTFTADSTKAERDRTRFAKILKERTRAEATRDTALRQLNLIKTIDQDRFIWSHVMDEVSRALPTYTWLTMVAFTGTPQGSVNNAVTPPTPKDTGDPKRPRKAKRIETEIPPDPIMIRIMGRTVDIEALPRFMTQLEASPWLSPPQLDWSKHLSDVGQEIEFQLTIQYSRPDSAHIRRVPMMMRMR